MKNAKQVLEEFTALSLRDPEEASAMFSENGAFEMPYLESLGLPWRYEGREKIAGFFQFVRDLYPDLEFHNVKVVCEMPAVAVGEYEFTTKSSRTGRTIHQLFVGRYEVDNGKITLLRESLNLVELGLAIYTNGLADYKILEG
ncbi:MAG: nuclear transport factor 2 family protein [Acidobacteriota bacterium]|nr:nuclear transport factor 2 family protein [Acidobacteriota bacterium]